jgi:organic radical activating enzyme
VKTYRINEIFFSLQGEGIRTGTANCFLRFSNCNIHCRHETHGFECDTEFETGRDLTADQIVSELRRVGHECDWVVLTGGEPALQLDEELINILRRDGFKLAIETNGTIALPEGLDWITVSPKVPEDQIRQKTADEVKYVVVFGQPLPQTSVQARYKLISPAFTGTTLDRQTLDWCVKLVKENQSWRLSVQIHKFIGIP